MRIGEIERVGEREIPMPTLTPLPPEPAAPKPPAPATVRITDTGQRATTAGIANWRLLAFPQIASCENWVTLGRT